MSFFFCKQKTAYEIGLGIPAEPLFRSQSPMLGFHKQMDNRIKLLEEILSFRMQGVEFRSEERFSRNAETDLVCRLLLEKKKQRANLKVHKGKGDVRGKGEQRQKRERPIQ